MATKIAPLIVIVGQTASGKSELGMSLASKFNGEIICADSRTIYKGMDIGTAKPSKQDQTKIKHHLVDIIEPNQRYSAARFKKDAQSAITSIDKRGKLPIMVGGSGLYLDSVLFNYRFSDSDTPKDTINPRHKNKEFTPVNKQLREKTLIIGILPKKEILKERIHKRLNDMLSSGLIEETQKLVDIHGGDLEIYKGSAYDSVIKYINGDINKKELIKLMIESDIKLSKKQRTWFKKNPSIKWVCDQNQAIQIVEDWLNQSP